MLALALPAALAQQQTLRIELAPQDLVAHAMENATTLVRVHNQGLAPIVVVLSSSNATGGLEVRFDVEELSVLPGGSAATGASVRGSVLGDHQVLLRAQERTALGGSGQSASALLRVSVVAPNATENATRENGTLDAPANATPDAAPPEEPPASAPHVEPPPEEPATEETPPEEPAPPLPKPRPAVGALALDVERGGLAPFRVRVENPADEAQRFDVALELPMGWSGTLATRTLDVPPRGFAEAAGTVSPTARAAPAEGTLRITGAGGTAHVRLALHVPTDAPAAAPSSTAPAAAPEPAPPSAPAPTPSPSAPTLRVVPSEVGAARGTSVLLTVYVRNPGEVPLEGRVRVATPPLVARLDAPEFAAAPGEESAVTVLVTIPDDVAIGTLYEGRASTTLSEVSVPFLVRIESAEAAPVAPAPDASTPGWVLAAAAGGLAVAAGVAAAWRRWPALGLLPLYARLTRQRALDHPRRAAMLSMLREEPGLTLAEVRRRMGLSNGVARHHVALLEAIGVVRVVPDGTLRRLWPVGEPARAVPPLRERALDALRERGAMRAAELADSLGVSRQALHYHVKRLVDEGRIVQQREGAELVLLPA